MIAALCREHSLAMVCEALSISRSGAYAKLSRTPPLRSVEDAELGVAIERIHSENRRVYGYPRVRLALRRIGRFHSRRRVARIMRSLGLKGRRRGKSRPWTTDSRHELGYEPNLLAFAGRPDRPHLAWVSDTTYIRTDEGWAYLAATMDLCSRYVVGWSMSRRNDGELAVSSLESASRRHGGIGVLHHSDRGSTYASHAYREKLGEMDAVASMSGKGNCYDNAAMESFFGTLKAECVEGVAFRDLEQAQATVFAYIEGFYNTRRIHTSIGMAPLEKLREALPASPGCPQRGCGDLPPAESSPRHGQPGLDTRSRISITST